MARYPKHPTNNNNNKKETANGPGAVVLPNT